MKKFIINPHPLDYKIEEYISKSLNLIPPYSYSQMSKKEFEKIKINIIKKFNLDNPENPENPNNSDILENFNYIKQIRSNIVKEHMIYSHQRLIKLSKNIIRDYFNHINILELSKKYDGSPLNILRIVFEYKYNKKLSKIISSNEISNSYDQIQLKIGLSNDIYALVDQTSILAKSIEFENDIKIILDENLIKYKTQEILVQEQINKSGFASNTPDFLILDNLIINNNIVKWIDAKNFFGSNIKWNKKKIYKQTLKYIKEWGPGLIVFRNYSSKLSFDSIQLVDYKSFKNLKKVN